MYSTCIVWLAFIPIFFGTHHDYQVSIKASLSFLLFQHNHHHCESLSFPDQSQMTQKSTTNTNITNTNVNIMLLQCWSFVNIILNHHDHHPPSPPGPIVEPVHVRHCQCHRRPLSHVRTEDVTRQYQHHLYSYHIHLHENDWAQDKLTIIFILPNDHQRYLVMLHPEKCVRNYPGRKTVRMI